MIVYVENESERNLKLVNDRSKVISSRHNGCACMHTHITTIGLFMDKNKSINNAELVHVPVVTRRPMVSLDDCTDCCLPPAA